ncbi:MAG TPA: M50 family metallopeptidase [Thermoanaerobaculia bacterium]|nr:M50 family metallopeptidase [Thermoanaerobaculia bacterium]
MRIGSIAGSPIHVQAPFLILVGLFVLLDLERGDPFHQAVLWLPILLLSVLAHEIGHALTIRGLGFGPSVILLTGFGGLTVNQRKAKPWQDALVAVAGPLTSFFLAILIAVVLAGVPFLRSDPMFSRLLPMMQWANVVWGIFNLVPIYPLDGGHALHDLSRYAVSPRTSVLLSAWSSMAIAALVLVAAIYLRQLFVVLIAALLIFQNYQRWKSYRED